MDASQNWVLVVDDDPLVTSTLSYLLESSGFAFECVDSVAKANAAIARRQYDAILLDMYLPDGEGTTVLARALEVEPAPAVLLMTAQAEVRAAVEAMRLGAADYLEKPLDLDDLKRRLARVLETATLKRKLAQYEAKDEAKTSLVAESPLFREVNAIAARVAATPSSSALLLGESGVGKEVLAARIHEMSARCHGPFVRVNLAAIPDTMIEAELLGSVRGAFTDSKKDRLGHFASADGGTILLDEVFELRADLQPKLLRVLEERKFYPVGSDRERRMDVRVLAATNQNPEKLIAEGTLRSDFYYRLSTVTIRIPPLRERREDIVPLAEHFAARYAGELGRGPVKLTDAGKTALETYAWPGNVRELRNVIERAIILHDGSTLDARSLGLAPSHETSIAHGDVPSESMRLEDVERAHIRCVLDRVNGSRTRAAEILGISRSTLWEKAKRYGLA